MRYVLLCLTGFWLVFICLCVCLIVSLVVCLLVDGGRNTCLFVLVFFVCIFFFDCVYVLSKTIVMKCFVLLWSFYNISDLDGTTEAIIGSCHY